MTLTPRLTGARRRPTGTHSIPGRVSHTAAPLQGVNKWHASSGQSTPRRSAGRSSSRPAATAASGPACTARPRSRSPTPCVYNYNDRKDRKGDFRQLWIQRINAAARANGITYNRFIQGLKAANIEVDRKILAELAVNDAAAFAALVEVAQKALPSDVNAPEGRLTGSLTELRHRTRRPRCLRVRRCPELPPDAVAAVCVPGPRRRAGARARMRVFRPPDAS